MTAIATESRLQPILESIAVLRNAANGPWSLAVVDRTIRLGEMSPLHVHDEDEAFQVVEGSIAVQSGEEVVRLEAGDVFVAPKGIPHTLRGESKRSHYLAMTSARSVGRYEDFLRAVARPGPSAEWTSPEEAAVVRVIAEPNGITVLGAPGAVPGA